MSGEYGFIPFETCTVQRESFEAFTHDRFRENLCRGQWTFRLTNTTRMVINTGTDEEGFPKARNAAKSWLKSSHPVHLGQPVIPCSSLKGLIRSLYECLTHSCLKQVAESYRDYQSGGKHCLEPKPYEVEPLLSDLNGLKPCTELRKLCPACRLFGTLTRGTVWKGRVFIGDGMLEPGQNPELKPKTLPILSTPRPKRRENSQFPDYFPNGCMAGRKRYQAGTRTKRVAGKPHSRTHDHGLREVTGETLKPNHHFTVRVGYQNLTRAEVGVLLRCFLLEEGLHHVLGSAKAHGWGACHFALTDWKRIDPVARYRGENGIRTIDPENWEAEHDALLAEARACKLYHPNAFEKLRPFLKAVPS